MNFLFLFLDGVGLGADDPAVNPLAKAAMPNLQALLGGHRLVEGVAPQETERATLLSLDATLGVEGMPQSATGQAALLTGRNVPAEVGEHYGPKPNPPVADILRNGNLFSSLKKQGKTAALLNAYPPGFFKGIESGRRLYSAIPLAVTHAGFPLFNEDDLFANKAMSVEFTGQGWRDHLGYEDSPIREPDEAGRHLAKLAKSYDFAFFEHWLSDIVGHRQAMEAAVEYLETFDGVLGGLLETWDDEAGLVLITSDHGNLENLDTRRHTHNPVPGLVIGAEELRRRFVEGMRDLTDVAPGILRMFAIS